MQFKSRGFDPTVSAASIDARDDATRRGADRATLSRIFARARPELTAIYRVIREDTQSLHPHRWGLFLFYGRKPPAAVFAESGGAASLGARQKARFLPGRTAETAASEDR